MRPAVTKPAELNY